MTADDIKNNEILEELFSKNFALKPESVEFAKKWLKDPQLDPMFKNIVGDDFRARWDVPVKELGEKEDTAWNQFKRFFPKEIFESITYENFINNNIVVSKNTIKLSKFISSWCISNKSIFVSYVENAVSRYREDYDEIKFSIKDIKDFALVNVEAFAALINKYILNINEVVGKKKVPKDLAGYQLVLSFNFADWLLVSTATSYTSCISLESHYGFWYGLPFILDDRNRALLYLVKKAAPKKEYLGIKVDNFSNREWMFLSEEENLIGFKWYPKDTPMALRDTDIKRITGLPIRFNTTINYSKYPIGENIHIKNTISFFATPYLDVVGTIEKTGKFYYTTRSGSNGVNKLGNRGGVEDFSFMFSPISLASMVKAKLDREEVTKYNVCDSCGEKVERSIHMEQILDEKTGNKTTLCKKCFTEKYTPCPLCKKPVLKKDLVKAGQHKKGICSSCFETHYIKCAVCGEYVAKKESVNSICNSCLETDKVVKCYVTREPMPIKKAINFLHLGERIYFSSENAFSYFLDSERLKEEIDFNKCSFCGEIKSSAETDYMFDGSILCHKCSAAIADKKQFKFELFDKKAKKEARAG